MKPSHRARRQLAAVLRAFAKQIEHGTADPTLGQLRALAKGMGLAGASELLRAAGL